MTFSFESDGSGHFTASDDALLKMPNMARECLIHTGLPQMHEPQCTFVPDSQLKYLPDRGFRIGWLQSLTVILRMPHCEIVLEDSDGKMIYCNGNIEMFVSTLHMYHSMLRASADSDNHARREIVKRVEEQIRTADPTALDAEENYWAMIFEDILYEVE